MEKSSTPRKLVPLVLRVAPGLANLLEYRRKWLRHDAVVGVSVAAVALPTAIAYAQLIGFDPVAGLYAAILPLVVYAVLGTSPHLIVNPDAATCAMVGATLMPLTALEPNSLVSLSMVLAIFTGIICIRPVSCVWVLWRIFSPSQFSWDSSTRGHPSLGQIRQGLWF